MHVGKRRMGKLRLFPTNCYRSAHLNLGGRGEEWILGNLKHDICQEILFSWREFWLKLSKDLGADRKKEGCRCLGK